MLLLLFIGLKYSWTCELYYRDLNYKGLVSTRYKNTFEALGYENSMESLAYGSVDLLLSDYGLYIGVLRKGLWKLFYYINIDYVHSYQ